MSFGRTPVCTIGRCCCCMPCAPDEKWRGGFVAAAVAATGGAGKLDGRGPSAKLGMADVAGAGDAAAGAEDALVEVEGAGAAAGAAAALVDADTPLPYSASPGYKSPYKSSYSSSAMANRGDVLMRLRGVVERRTSQRGPLGVLGRNPEVLRGSTRLLEGRLTVARWWAEEKERDLRLEPGQLTAKKRSALYGSAMRRNALWYLAVRVVAPLPCLRSPSYSSTRSLSSDLPSHLPIQLYQQAQMQIGYKRSPPQRPTREPAGPFPRRSTPAPDPRPTARAGRPFWRRCRPASYAASASCPSPLPPDPPHRGCGP